jgi:glucose-6-phosphate isomerase
MGYTTWAVLPFSQVLKRFPTQVQLINMERKGKRITLDGVKLLHPSGEINFGDLMHQDCVIPANSFIGFMESQCPMELPGKAISLRHKLQT